MDSRNNQKLRQMTARDTVKIRRVNNGYVINSASGMRIAPSLEEVVSFLKDTFQSTVNTK